ncbi:RidA family protein [Amycolatopsis sp. 195334CR]|uniref:RidA family protein n=1 Tax=Amycolatopsis sp. 195334CR TaxID=2814588 RepID=UPI001A8F1140|nr:RidA family protein [Amycolatopsis sp. 195334CR]MBN6040952.1 RidA family protein [Amycolatopsis sp. 195334CR]
MSHTIVNPAGLADPVPYGYSHVARTDGGLVFVAGQWAAGTDGHLIDGDFAAQVRQSFANLKIALAASGLGFESVVRLGTYIVDHDEEKLTVLGSQIAGIWGGKPPTQTLLGVAKLALPGMLFEVDAVAV